jgi:class 3 adenylate cyclase
VEPQIQYVKTRDGVNIACYAMGNGPPMLLCRLPMSHVQAEWRFASNRRQYEMIARAATLIRFDHRGWGASDRDVADVSLAAYASDIEAVIDALVGGPARIVATDTFDSAIAVAYAAAHPERVEQLVLTNATVRATPEFRKFGAQFDKIVAMGDADWEFASESATRFAMGWGDEEAARETAALFRESVSPAFFLRFAGEYLTWDIGDLLPRVTAPVLLVHNTDDVTISEETTREMATLLPDARIALNSGATVYERMRRREAVVAEFLFGIQLPASPRIMTATAVILFLDIADSTSITERIGDAAFRDRARGLDAVLRSAILDRAGTPIDGTLLGDGVLATFSSARDAIRAAERCSGAGTEAGLPLHAGIHAGDVIREADNVFGGAVNVAARISALSAAGEVLVSDVVRGLARTSSGVEFEDRGEHALKGVSEPQRVFAVRGHGVASP